MASEKQDREGDDDLPELAYDEIVIMRLKEDEAVVSVHVTHAMNDEMIEQLFGARLAETMPEPEDHAAFEALAKLWKVHREAGWDATELMLDLEKLD